MSSDIKEPHPAVCAWAEFHFLPTCIVSQPHLKYYYDHPMGQVYGAYAVASTTDLGSTVPGQVSA